MCGSLYVTQLSPHISANLSNTHLHLQTSPCSHIQLPVTGSLPCLQKLPQFCVSSFLAFDDLPGSEELQHVREIHSPRQTDVEHQSTSQKRSPPILICNGLPPVPAKLLKRVEDGMYIEMSELLPDHLSSAELNCSSQSTSSKSTLGEVNNIMDWIDCFGIYIAIMSRSAPHRVADLIGYQSMIISASQKRQAGRWVIYDRRFRLKASATKNVEWSTYDVTIGNQVYPDSSVENHQPKHFHPTNPVYRPPRPPQVNSKRQICLNWNDSPDGCTRPACRYDHACLRCIHNPQVMDKGHKAIDCPHKGKKRGTPAQ